MTTNTPEPVPLFEHFTVTYRSGTVIPSFDPSGLCMSEQDLPKPTHKYGGPSLASPEGTSTSAISTL